MKVFDIIEQNDTFPPLVPDILPTQWFLWEKKKGKERIPNLWDIWHIYYTHYSDPVQYVVLLNIHHEFTGSEQAWDWPAWLEVSIGSHITSLSPQNCLNSVYDDKIENDNGNFTIDIFKWE